ncbi:hypothetical protein PHMEG_00028746 [Phytophthora megakarya]|uniref:Uncharacterized protein n=1 Tax=Phytophthora megakarya TaxID=4795 RepID=A0A225V2I9_9STRA|nr:hypothetical protein PHMEG_00028746 [Phytophthora megakarya]
MASMANHLRLQEYSRPRDASSSLLREPHLSDKDAGRWVEANKRNDTSATNLLDMVTSPRPLALAASTHAVPSGDVRIHVKSSQSAGKLDGQESNLLGRKFTIKHQPPLAIKFYLDIFEIRSTATANAFSMSLAKLGAPPLALTLKDVNIQAQVITPTWCFYVGQEQPPACPITRGFVTNQLVYGRNIFIVREKRSPAPPQRSVRLKQSPYAMVLPTRLVGRKHQPGHSDVSAGAPSELNTTSI